MRRFGSWTARAALWTIMAPFGLLALLSAVCALMVGCLISVVADCYGRGRGR